jgi:hypothetical protein
MATYVSNHNGNRSPYRLPPPRHVGLPGQIEELLPFVLVDAVEGEEIDEVAFLEPVPAQSIRLTFAPDDRIRYAASSRLTPAASRRFRNCAPTAIRSTVDPTRSPG